MNAREMQERCAKIADAIADQEDYQSVYDERGNINLYALRLAVWDTAKNKIAAAIRALPCPAVAPATEPPADLGLETTTEELFRWGMTSAGGMERQDDRGPWTRWEPTKREIDRLSAEVVRLTKEAEGWRASANQAAEEANRAEAHLRKAEQGLAKMAAAVAPDPAAAEVEAMARAAARAIAATYYNADNLTWAMTGRLTEIAEIEIAALLRRLLPSPTGEGWRPIESAPKDGTKIDLLYPYPRGRAINCQWTGALGMGWHWKEPTWKHGELLPETEWDWHSYPAMEPTHWRPLPEPPK
jgi:hypothetical protein